MACGGCAGRRQMMRGVVDATRRGDREAAQRHLQEMGKSLASDAKKVFTLPAGLRVKPESVKDYGLRIDHKD